MKRKFLKPITLASELKVGDRILFLKDVDVPHKVPTIGYVDSFTTDKTMVYIDHRWRKNRVVSLWGQIGGRDWDLSSPRYGQFYLTNMKLNKALARLRSFNGKPKAVHEGYMK